MKDVSGLIDSVYFPGDEQWVLRRLAYLGYYGGPEGMPNDVIQRLESKDLVKEIVYPSGHDGYELTEDGVALVLEFGGGIATDWDDETSIDYPESLKHLEQVGDEVSDHEV